MKRIFSFTGKRAKERLGLTQDLMEIALGEMYYLNHDSRCIKCWSDVRGQTTDLHDCFLCIRSQDAHVCY